MRSSLLCLIHLCGAVLGDVEITIEHPSTDWESARKICQTHKHLLLPDLGDGFFLLPQMPVGSFFWINAKALNVSYPGGTFAYLKYALYPATSTLERFMCYKTKGDVIAWFQNASWNRARDFCKTDGWQLLDLTKPSKIRHAISVLQFDTSAWLENVTDYNLLSLESLSENITESCVGIVKLQSGKVLYQKDDCFNRHAYFCVHLGINRYATTLNKLSTPIENVSEKNLNGPSTLPGPDTASFKGNMLYMPKLTKLPLSAIKATEKNLEERPFTTKVIDFNIYDGIVVGVMALIGTLVAAILIQRICGCIRCRKRPKEMPPTASISLNANQAYDDIDNPHIASTNPETKSQSDVKSKYETLIPEAIQTSEYSFALDVNGPRKTQCKVGEHSRKGNKYNTTQPFRKAPSTDENVYDRTYTPDLQENVYNKTSTHIMSVQVCLGENVYNETDTYFGENVYNKTFDKDVSQVQVPVTNEYGSLKMSGKGKKESDGATRMSNSQTDNIDNERN